MTSRNQKVWVQVNTVESWHLNETTVCLQLLFHFFFEFHQCPAERNFGECSLTNCRAGSSQCPEKQILRVWPARKTSLQTFTEWQQGKVKQWSGKAEETEKPEPTHDFCTMEAEDWGIWAGASSCPDGLRNPSYFPNTPSAEPQPE